MSAEQSTSRLDISMSQTGRKYNEEYSWEMHEKCDTQGRCQMSFSKGSSAFKKKILEFLERGNSMWVMDMFDKIYLKTSKVFEENNVVVGREDIPWMNIWQKIQKD